MTPEQWIQRGKAMLADAGIPEPLREAKLLWQNRGEAGDYLAMVTMRARRVPMSQVLGYRDFYAHRFAVTADVLDPRPDTESWPLEALIADLQYSDLPLVVEQTPCPHRGENEHHPEDQALNTLAMRQRWTASLAPQALMSGQWCSLLEVGSPAHLLPEVVNRYPEIESGFPDHPAGASCNLSLIRREPAVP